MTLYDGMELYSMSIRLLILWSERSAKSAAGLANCFERGMQ